jgi:hypothetical protein
MSKPDQGQTPDELAIEVQRPADPFVEPLSLLASQLSEVATSILQLERSHSEHMENAAARFRDQIAADLQNRHQGQLDREIQLLREEFEQRMCSATDQWEAERQSLLKEMEHLRHRKPSELAEEIALTEAALDSLQETTRQMLDDPAVELSRLMQENARQEKLQAYLQGLKFNA